MLNHRVAVRYAKSLTDLALERGQLEEIKKDMQHLKALCKASPDFIFVLKNPLIEKEKKSQAIKAVVQDKVSELTLTFIRLVITKKRESYLPQIADAFMEQYRAHKSIHKVKLITAVPVNEAIKILITQKIKSETRLKAIHLECLVNEALIGGFVLEYDNKLVDASLQRGIKRLESHFEKAQLSSVSQLQLEDF